MKRFLTLAVLIFSISLIFQCQTREDDALDKAIFTYALLCEGGSLGSCQQGCADRFPNVTGENFNDVERCQGNCTTNCNFQNIFLLLEAQ